VSDLTGVVILAQLVPTSPDDAYPTHAAEYGKGGARSVADLTARDAIPALRREELMTVGVIANGKTYRLVGGITNDCWLEVSGGVWGEITGDLADQDDLQAALNGKDAVGAAAAAQAAAAADATSKANAAQAAAIAASVPTSRKVNGKALSADITLTASDVGAAATSHEHAASAITSGTLDGDRLPAMSAAKAGAVPATGTPSGKFLRDDATWQSGGSGGGHTIENNGTDLTARAKLNFKPGLAAADDGENAVTTITPDVHALTEKPTAIADNDEFQMADSAANNVTKKSLWSTLKSVLKTYFDGIYCATGDSRLTDARTPTAHVLDSASHTVTGETPGYFLKALSATTFGFSAHGLTASDVGAAPSSGIAPAALSFTATSKVLGRKTAGAGAGEELSGADILTLAGAAPASGNAISIINASATSRIFGRATAGAGAGEELTGAQVLALIGAITSANSIRETITQASHGFAAKSAIRHNGTSWVGGLADSATDSEVQAIVESVNGNDFVAVYSSKLTVSGLTAGQYYLDPASAGAITQTAPTTPGQIVKPLFWALSATVAIVRIQPGRQL
jgi:predicted RNA-binding protein associated with RNAse of E/G family